MTTIQTVIEDDTVEPSIGMSHLRRTFFNDLEKSSQIRRRENEVSGVEQYDAVHTVAGSLHHYFSFHGEAAPPAAETPRGRTDSPPVVWDRCASYTHMSRCLPPTATPPNTAAPQSRIQATSAMLANGVAGTLVGVGLRRFASAAATQICSGIIFTQLLCSMGYASVVWGDLTRDVASLVLYGTPTKSEQMDNRFYYFWRRLLERLTATVPRRASFFLGVVTGVLFL